MSDVIEIHGLIKRFGRYTALDGLDLTLKRGEVLGFLGPNGAGKSTTIRTILGLLRADSGHVELFGQDPWRNVVTLHRRLAYVPGDVNLWPTLTGGEAIDLLARLRGGINEHRRKDLIEAFDLDPRKKGRTYSKGNRQKVAIIAALASDAELLILDEPSAGLDPIMEKVFRDEILRVKAVGTSVLLSSHIMSEVEALADRISIIASGRVLQTGTLVSMQQRARTSITARLQRPPDGIAEMPGVHDVHTVGDRLRCTVEAAELPEFMMALAAFGIVTLTSEPPSLEELFLSHYSPGSRSRA